MFGNVRGVNDGADDRDRLHQSLQFRRAMRKRPNAAEVATSLGRSSRLRFPLQRQTGVSRRMCRHRLKRFLQHCIVSHLRSKNRSL